MTTPVLAAPDLVANQAIPESTVNEIVRRVEQGAQYFNVLDKDLTAPPGSPADGDAYIVGPSATGAWSGQDEAIAYYQAGTGWLFIAPRTGFVAYVQDEATEYRYLAGVWGSGGAGNPTISLMYALSDEATALTAGAGKLTVRLPFAFTLTGVRASLTTAQTSGSIFTVDINEGGTTILSTKITIDNTEKTSTTAATPAVISDTALADDAELTFDIDQIGDGTATGLKVYLIGQKT